MDTSKLTPANENPWYVLMTLYGEHEGKWIDRGLHNQNRAVWNAWSCQGLDDAAAAEVAALAQVNVVETRGWAEIAAKVKREHRAEMKRRNADSDFTYPGFPDFENLIGCSEIQFFNTVVLKNCIFTQLTDFTSATFTQLTDFTSATFTRIADFRSASFTQDAYFHSSTFTERADFRSATFTQDANFGSTRFTQAANFTATTFAQYAVFSSSTFTQVAYFRSASFTQDAYFISATFTQDASFTLATFTQDASFTFATFDGPAKFVKTKFGVRDGTDVSVPLFTEAAFARLVSFREAEFVTHYPVLEGTVFHETVVVTAKPANWPKVGQQLLDKAVSAVNEVPTKEVAKDSCATLRHAMGKQGRPEEEHFFFKREMTLAGEIGGWFDRAPYRLFGWVSGYGGSILRPTVGLGGVWLMPSLFYMVVFVWQEEMHGADYGAADPFTLSFASIFKFFGFQRTYFGVDFMQALPPVIQALTALQTVAGFILLFFLGLGLRTRFRLR